MKIIKLFSAGLMAVCCAFLVVGCGAAETKVTLGTYDAANSTFTALQENAGYNLEQSGNKLVLKGEIPYSNGVLGIEAGNIIALRFEPTTEITPDEQTKIQTTNNQDEESGGWNEYDQTALEEDGSLIWVTSVNKTESVQIKIKWNKDFEEVTYTLSVDQTATLSTATA